MGQRVSPLRFGVKSGRSSDALEDVVVVAQSGVYDPNEFSFPS